MRLGFKYATQSGLSLGLPDLLTAKHKHNILRSVRKKTREMINNTRIVPHNSQQRSSL